MSHSKEPDFAGLTAGQELPWPFSQGTALILHVCVLKMGNFRQIKSGLGGFELVAAWGGQVVQRNY